MIILDKKCYARPDPTQPVPKRPVFLNPFSLVTQPTRPIYLSKKHHHHSSKVLTYKNSAETESGFTPQGNGHLISNGPSRISFL
ncbi:hypothetical protein HanIR_Chr16g0836451 [Helianthus annuus]|nr:hypothetical protein HanIR_Chr16g0836451 [Helianthus annuus]